MCKGHREKSIHFWIGNKRSGLLTAALFLETNGFVFASPEEEAVLWTVALGAEGGAEKLCALR